MEVRLLIHAEPAQDSGRLVWWIESPDVPGFSSAADGLVEVRVTSERAITDLLGEREEPVTFSYQLVSHELEDEGIDVGWTGAGAPGPRDSGPGTAKVARVHPHPAGVSAVA